MKISVIIAAIMLPLWLAAYSTTADSVHFFEGNVAELQEQAHNYGKMPIVYFYASWCMPCKWMEKNTFNHPTLAKYINENYFPIRVNIDDPEGKNDQEKYDVTLIPTLLIFNHDGDLIARYEEAISARSLSKILQKHFVPGQPTTNISTEIQEAPVESDANNSLTAPRPLNIYYPPLVPEEYQKTKPSAEPVKIHPPNEKESEVIENPIQPTLNYYYSVQLGAFSNQKNAEQKMGILQETIDKNLYIKKTVINGNSIFRILSGQYQKENDAKAIQKQLLQRGINGFVKKIDN